MVVLRGRRWVSLYQVAEIFDVHPSIAARLRTQELVRVRETDRGTHQFNLADVQRLANTPGWYATRARNVLRQARRT